MRGRSRKLEDEGEEEKARGRVGGGVGLGTRGRRSRLGDEGEEE